MSTIIATTLSNGSVSVPTATVVNGSAKAWVNFNGTGTKAIRDSLNVASLTDNGTGDYTVNFTAAMNNANYNCAVYVRSDLSTPNSNHCLTSAVDATKTVSAFRCASRYANATAVGVVDTIEAGLTFHGDLA